MLKKIILFAFAFNLLISFAQQNTITGSISNKEFIESVTVNLFNTSGNKLIKSVFCESNGNFIFNNIKNGTYFIKIQSINFNSYSTDSFIIQNPGINLQPITLTASSKDLAEVTVANKKLFVERKIDRVVINPDALISNTAVTALEVLEKSPGVLVDVNGNISLNGRQGVQIFVDDKPLNLSSADAANYLKTITASNVDVLELMVTPPAKYDAAGTAGIINIKLKKIKQKGFVGIINTGYGQGTYLRSNNSLSFNYRINKFNFSSNLSHNQNNSFQDLTINRFYFTPTGSPTSTFKQNTYFAKFQRSTSAKIGVDVYATNKSTFGFSISGFNNPFIVNTSNNAVVLDNNNSISSKVNAYNPSTKHWKNINLNVNYNYKLDNKGSEILLSADFIEFNLESNQVLTNNILDANNTFISSSTLQSSLPATIKISTAKIDITKILPSNIKLETGVKASLVQSKNNANFYEDVSGVLTPNYVFSNNFNYKENINAAYLTLSKDFKKLTTQLGVRLENTNVDATQYGNPTTKDSSFTLHYTNLFPTVFLQYQFDSIQKHQLIFSASRRIQRPNYQDMNPFTYPIDRYTFYGGNPFLQPTFSYNIELSHIYKNWLTTTLEYSYAKNLIQETNEQRNGIYYSRPGNFGKQISYGISVNATFKVTNWWNMQVYGEYKNLGYESLIYNQVLNDNKFYWYIGPNNQFTINKNLTAEFNASYQSSILVAQFTTIPVSQASIGFSQKILKGKGTIKLALSDIFYSNQPGGDINNIENSKANWKSILDSRVISVGLNYRFNKGKTLQARKISASDEEKVRVKQS